jgi:hypothetical protein
MCEIVSWQEMVSYGMYLALPVTSATKFSFIRSSVHYYDQGRRQERVLSDVNVPKNC